MRCLLLRPRLDGECEVLDADGGSLIHLGEHAGSLAEHGQQIASALDELLTRSWG